MASADATLSATVGLETATESGNGTTIDLSQRSDAGHQYRARARFATSGRLILWISRLNGSTSDETIIAPATVALTGLTSNSRVRLEFSVSGSDAVAVRARAALVDKPTSNWQVTGADTSNRRLTAAGGVQVGAYLSTGSARTTALFDDLTLEAKIPEGTPSASPTPTPSPTATPSFSPTASASPSPSTPATNEGSTGSAGSLPVGASTYSVPSGAIFVKAGATQGDGSKSKPFGSLNAAMSRATSGSTIVLREGTYHETVRLAKLSNLTVQSYPNEAVWFDGASNVTGWRRSGSTWVVDGWTHEFDSRVSFSRGVDESRRFVDPAYPMAGHPDQVWIDGQPLTQVGSRGEVTTGKFFVDSTADKLYIGSDPSGRKVEASTLAQAIQVQAPDSTLRGFGVRRYANTLSLMGALTAEVPRITFENLVVTQNATVGIYAWAADHKFRHLTVSDNGLMGLGANVATRLSLTDSVFARNNLEHFKWAPVSGGVKITKSEGVVITGNTFSDNVTAGLWFDDSSYDVTITNNVIRRNATLGILIEATDKALLADNYVHENGKGIVAFDSGNLQIWNNTLVANTRTMEFMQDGRRQINTAIADRIPWIMRNVSVKNNVLSYGSGSCPMLTQDLTLKWAGNDFGIVFDGNLYYRSSTSNPANFACWANGSAGTRTFKTFEAFRSQTGSDANSAYRERAGVTDSSFQVTSDASKSAGLSPRPLPASVARPIGQSTNSVKLGAVSSY